MRVSAGTVLFREGEPGEVMYLLREGRISVTRHHGGGEELLAELGPGAILGEMSLLDRRPRSATATVLEDAELAIVDGNAWEQVCASLPAWLSAVVRVVVDRLRETNVRKHREDVQHAVPALLFVLLKRPDTGAAWMQEDVVRHLGILYGIERKDVVRLVAFLSERGLLSPVPESGDLRLVCREHHLMGLAWEVLSDRASPKPTGENQLAVAEVQVLLALLDAAAREERRMGGKLVVTLPQLQESMKLKVQDQAQFQPLIRLNQNGTVQLMPVWSLGTPITSKHQVAFDEEKVRELLALHRLLEDLARLSLD